MRNPVLPLLLSDLGRSNLRLFRVVVVMRSVFTCISWYYMILDGN